jgi:polyisoprenyl-teichoic acid--peptidoglycan teichoic acid transferase
LVWPLHSRGLMHGLSRKRALWTAVLALAGLSYGACAWLWAAPYRPAPPADSIVAAGPRRPPVSGPIASIAEPVPSTAPVAPVTIVAQPARTPALASTRNFLIVGLDRRADGSGAALADSLVLVVLDERTDHVGLISIPRDLYVAIPEATTDRINTVYNVARHSRRDPLELLSRVVEDTLTLPVEHALALDLGVFERAVDAVGGVDVDVQCPIRDNFVDSREVGGRRLLDLDAGQQHLDGATAAMYVRSRHGRSDFSRARRQQAVLLGVQHALSGQGLLKLPELWDAFESSVETDMRRIQLLALARRALSVEPSHLHGLVIGHEHVTGFRTPEGKSVVLPKFEAIDAALAKLFSAPSPGLRARGAACEPKDVALAGPS